VDLEWDDPVNGPISFDGSGWGYGVYGRAGVEVLASGTWIGLGLRAADSSLDPGNGLDDFEFESLQIFVTATRAL